MSGEPETRAFLALPPDPVWSESASLLLQEIRPSSPKAAWTRPSAWHLTVHFVGNSGAGKLRSFAASVAAAASAVRAGTLDSGGAAVFPPRRPARVLAVGFAPSEGLSGLSRLADAARSAARELGLQTETRPFRPHVTLARIRDRWPSAAVARFRSVADGWPFPAWTMKKCVLYASRLGREGASHVPLAEWTFGPDAASERTA